ncbi:DUF2322 family protein [Neisseria leonii]|uniref:DUF2322 family protein n=1 Tax=Neisseria leonii TaxID=2995413 RepID=A0A9X4E341_9NEIS|nr:DUF2322 family protein [Neisseria sp. 51.81]MDD9328745.1 DUF2322 family protein [Neisseria sp. 51.81]
MNFQDYLAQMPDIGHLSGLNILNADGSLHHHIPAAPGKLGSLKLYHALLQQFGGTLDRRAAEQGLIWFAEHLADARANPGKHPNIDLLLHVEQNHTVLTLQAVPAA